MESGAIRILCVFLCADFFVFILLLTFLINARINIKRTITYKQTFYKVFTTAKKARSSSEAAMSLNMTQEQFRTYCEGYAIELPEIRIEKFEKQKKIKDDEQRRILEEEAAWRAEQERLELERSVIQEEEARKRKERLRKFGFA